MLCTNVFYVVRVELHPTAVFCLQLERGGLASLLEHIAVGNAFDANLRLLSIFAVAGLLDDDFDSTACVQQTALLNCRGCDAALRLAIRCVVCAPGSPAFHAASSPRAYQRKSRGAQLLFCAVKHVRESPTSIDGSDTVGCAEAVANETSLAIAAYVLQLVSSAGSSSVWPSASTSRRTRCRDARVRVVRRN